MDDDTLRVDIVTALRRIGGLPRRSEARRDALRHLAGLLVTLRGQYLNSDGGPDWLGSSAEYREALGALYGAAGVQAAERSSLGSTLRYHVREVLRERLPAAEVEALGLVADPAAERRERRRADGALLRSARGRMEGMDALTGVVVATAALEAVDREALRRLSAGPDRADVVERVGRLSCVVERVRVDAGL